jgi:hypothetical protein
MQKSKAKEMFEAAKVYCEKYAQDELDWAYSINQNTFKWMKSSSFLAEYCWVVYASGFKASTIEKKFPDLQNKFKGFDLKSLSKMSSIKSVLKVFNNERKANCFLKGSKLIVKEGFSSFKKRIKEQGVDTLEELPGIGPITKFHLAKNIGLVDAAKPDIWLVRSADACSSTVEELVTFLSKKYDISEHVVDVILWRYGVDKQLEL